MKAIMCERCGSNSWEEKDGFRICMYCKTKYKINETLQNGIESGIEIRSDIDRLLEKCKTDPKNAKKYANLILDIDADNQEALKYL